jgi:hypothetical protein
MTSRSTAAAPILAVLAVVLVCGCWGHTSPSHSDSTSVPCEPSRVLAALPVNSDQRCMGIAIVIEAMLGANSLEAELCPAAQTLADQLYANAASSDRIELPQFIESEGARMPLLSRAGLELISTLIADRHKVDFATWTKDQTSADRLARAQMNFVPSTESLREVLLSDVDHAVAFGGPGIRDFPDGEQRETHHAFVLQLRPDGGIIVYDPNDPDAPISCDLAETEDGVLIEWTGQYRDTGLRTTQAYYLVPVQDYLAVAFSL